MSEFNDSIQVFINNKLEFNGYVNTDKVRGDSNQVFGYNYSETSEKVTIKFISLTRSVCCFVDLNKRYKIVYVFIDKLGNWTIRFSNVHYIN
jgi:hypothetical protein